MGILPVLSNNIIQTCVWPNFDPTTTVAQVECYFGGCCLMMITGIEWVKWRLWGSASAMISNNLRCSLLVNFCVVCNPIYLIWSDHWWTFFQLNSQTSLLTHSLNSMVVIIILKLDSFRCHRIGSLHVYKKNTVRRLKGLLLLFLHYRHASHIELVNLFLSSHTNQIISNQILFLLPPLSIGSISNHSCYSPDLHEICYQLLHLAHNTQLHNLVTDTLHSLWLFARNRDIE